MCRCRDFASLVLRSDALAMRIREEASIRETLVAIAENAEENVTLYRCGACGAQWQGARAKIALFGQGECLYEVPPIAVEEWRFEPYVKPAELVLYASAMRRFFEKHAHRDGALPCATDGCRGRATEGESRCLHHHARAMQLAGVLPCAPSGRLFIPSGGNVTAHGRDVPRADAQYLEPLRPVA